MKHPSSLQSLKQTKLFKWSGYFSSSRFLVSRSVHNRIVFSTQWYIQTWFLIVKFPFDIWALFRIPVPSDFSVFVLENTPNLHFWPKFDNISYKYKKWRGTSAFRQVPIFEREVSIVQLFVPSACLIAARFELSFLGRTSFWWETTLVCSLAPNVGTRVIPL